MAKGIIYIMTTVVPGLIKIGKTGSDNFEKRMYQLERNGYFNSVLMNPEHPMLEKNESNRWRINMNIEIEIDEL